MSWVSKKTGIRGGYEARNSPHPLPLLSHPLPLLSNFLLTPGMLLHLPALSLTCSISPPGRGKEMAATKGYGTENACFYTGYTCPYWGKGLILQGLYYFVNPK